VVGTDVRRISPPSVFKSVAKVLVDLRQVPDHGSDDEIRETTIGSTGKMRIVVVSHISNDGIIRIISARKASSPEIRQYNEG
jgi:uncharacterized DUF497 family protein